MNSSELRTESEKEFSHDQVTDNTKESEKKESDSPKTKERDNESAEKAGKAVGVSSDSVKKAKKLQKTDPDLAERVNTGELALNKACEIAKDRRKAEAEAKKAEELREQEEIGFCFRLRFRFSIVQILISEMATDLDNAICFFNYPYLTRQLAVLWNMFFETANNRLKSASFFNYLYLPTVAGGLSFCVPLFLS